MQDNVKQTADQVFAAIAPRVTPEQNENLHKAFEFAYEAHSKQLRKTGEPYILHPIAVALICASELGMDADAIIAAFLHDVVEDTKYSIEDIEKLFGHDVAFLVKVLTKQKKEKYEMTKQLDNFKQMLTSIQHDVRAILIKIADRLHNMRTLSSMSPDKQMKIAGETDYFYAPMANRLGLYNVKTELENLSFKFRCPQEYEKLEALIKRDKDDQRERLQRFRFQIKRVLSDAGIDVKVRGEYRKPYSIWRKMQKFGDDFNHIKHRHFTEIIYQTPAGISEKDMALRIYSVLTNHFREKPGGITNYIDSPKENGYESFHVKLLPDFGRWQEVHISSERMIRNSQLGCMAEKQEYNIQNWLDKFRSILKDIARKGEEEGNFFEDVVSTFYNDDIMTFTPHGKPMVLPQRATALDFAYEVHTELGRHAKYARINNFLSSIKAHLRRGDVVEIFTDPESHPQPDWLDHVVTYKAKVDIEKYLNHLPKPKYISCPDCSPIPGEEVIGFRNRDGSITIHKRDCPTAIRLASQYGDNIVSVNYHPDDTLYPVKIVIKAVDRYHLFIDLVSCISNSLNLSIDSFNTSTVDSIVTIEMTFSVHSSQELQTIFAALSHIDGVDEVKRV